MDELNYFEASLIITAGLIIFSVIASKASSRFGVPALLLFLLIGMTAGSHGLTILPVVGYPFAQQLGVFALIFILFSGGMTTQMKSVKPVLKSSLILSTFGPIFSTAMIGFFSNQFLHFTLLEGFLLGATISSTDVAAVFTVLRSKSISLKDGIAPLLELESALNDPMTVFLGIGLLGLITQKNHSLISLIPLFLQQMALGGILGWAFGKVGTFAINRIKLEFEGLYPVLTIGWILLTFASTQYAGGSGFLAVYITGITLGNANLLHKKSLIHFHEGIAWLMQIAMFLTMGLLVSPAELLEVAPLGIALSLFLVFIARPLSVLLCLIRSNFNFNEKLVISWAGLRGAVPIILATYPFVAGIPQAGAMFNLVFFVTFISVLLQGASIPFVARLLKVEVPFQEKFRFPIEFNPSQNIRNLTSKLIEVPIPPGSRIIGLTLLELSLPSEILVILIQRNGDVIVPRGGTQIMKDDTFLVLAENQSADDIQKYLK